MKISNQLHTLFVIVSLLISSACFSHGQEKHADNESKIVSMDTESAKVVAAFHHALQTQDKVTARALLTDDLLVFEGKSVERSAEEYAAKHMELDMMYLQSIEVKPLEHSVQEVGSIAISTSRRSHKGVYKGNYIDRTANETITLIKTNDSWKISHIHWSH